MASTDVGAYREINQDNFYIMEDLRHYSELKHFTAEKKRKRNVLCAVCDGIGGGARGEEASLTALQCIEKLDINELYRMPSEKLVRKLKNDIQAINDLIYEQFRSEKIFAGCTMTLLYADVKRVLVGNIGDSPCIVVDKTGTSVISVSDNRANQLYQLGKITEEERWKHKTKNQLTQYLGMNPSEIRLSPHICLREPMGGEEIYILGTDGLIDKMGFQEISEAVRAEKKGNLGEVLTDAALRSGSRDNVTAIAVKTFRRGEG